MSESDFIREVDEELRNEQLKNLWDKFGPFVIGFALLIVLATAANKGYEYWRDTQAATSGDAFAAAIELSRSGNEAAVIAELEQLKASASGGYPLLADMRIAAEKAALGEVDQAIASYEAIASNSGYDAVFQDLARIRANTLKLDQGRADEVILQVSGLMDGNGFRHSARELVLLAHIEKQEYEQALPIAERIVADAESPSQLRQRAEVYVAYIRSRFAAPEAPAAATAGEAAQ